MKHIAIGIFILMILAIMGYLWHAIHEFRANRYGRCWPLIKTAIDDLLEHTIQTNRFYDQLKHRSELDLHILQDHILNYNGKDSIDEETALFDTQGDFFNSFKDSIKPHWYFDDVPILKILDDAIYAYNIDTEYIISPRQFLDYLGFQFEYYYTSKL